MNALSLYALSLEQITSAIISGGAKRTILVQGHMGTGKSSLLRTIGEALPNHTPCYFDCTTKDLGDITLPMIRDAEGTGYVQYATNEELGAHHNTPVILMVDEFGKANPAVKNALLRLMLERKIGSYELHPDSIIFATTNLGAEGVGDLLPPHARNRLTVINSRKPTAEEWIEWGVNNGIDPALLGWVKETPQIMASFLDVTNPDDNPYIYHPKAQRTSFVTPRSLEAASDWLKVRDSFDETTLTAMLIGTVGERAALDMAAFIKLADQLPTLDSIKRDPANAKIPKSDAAICMVVYRTLATIEKTWMDAWMTYLNRLDKEAQALFANGARAPKYARQSVVMTSSAFTKWALANAYLFSADKK